MLFNGYDYFGKGRNAALSVFLFILMGLVAVPGCVSDPQQARSFKALFDHYREQENVDAISFPPGLAGIFLDDSDPDQAELKKLMQELSSFRMLTLNENAEKGSSAGGGAETGEVAGQQEEMKETIMEFTRRNEFQDMFRMQSAAQDIILRIQEKDGIVREAILMLEAEGRFFIIDLRGNISLELFTRLAEGGYLDDLTGLSKFPKGY